MGQWKGPCQLPAIAWSLLPQLQHFRLCHQQSDWWGDSTNLFIFLYKHSNGKNRARGRNRDSVHVIKTAPQGKQSRLYSSIYFKKDLDCIYLPLKCKCHFLLERCITISKDPKPRNQHTNRKKNCRHTRPHIHFYFPINSCPARQEFHISCRDTETNSKLKFIFCVAAISAPPLSSPAVFLNLVLKIALLEKHSGS